MDRRTLLKRIGLGAVALPLVKVIGTPAAPPPAAMPTAARVGQTVRINSVADITIGNYSRNAMVTIPQLWAESLQRELRKVHIYADADPDRRRVSPMRPAFREWDARVRREQA